MSLMAMIFHGPSKFLNIDNATISFPVWRYDQMVMKVLRLRLGFLSIWRLDDDRHDFIYQADISMAVRKSSEDLALI